MDNQDWKQVTWNNKNKTVKNKKQIINKQSSTSQLKNKLDNTEIGQIKTIGKKVGSIIQKSRTAKKITQKDLAKLINQNTSVIVDYEKGTAKPNQIIINKLEIHLGVYLRGKNIGNEKIGKKSI